jgi:HEAT repeat protein
MARRDPFELDGASLPELSELLGSQDPGERADAATALGDRLRGRELEELEPALRQRLVALLSDADTMVRFEAAITLAEAHDPSGTATLVSALETRTLRLDATRALGASGDPNAVRPLEKLLSRWLLPWADRLQAAAALCALGDLNGAYYLKVRIDSSRLAERAAAIHFLGESHHPEARPLLEKILCDVTHPMRDVAARALGLLGDPAAKEALELARLDSDYELADDIDQAIAALARAAERAAAKG